MNADSNILCSILPLLQVKPEVQRNCNFSHVWRSEHEQELSNWASFHIVTKGSCLLHVKGEAPITLKEGDVAVLPQGQAHYLCSISGGVTDVMPEKVVSRTLDGLQITSNTDGESETRLVCGRVLFGPEIRILVSLLLPTAVIFTPAKGPDAENVRVLTDLIQGEFDSDRLGSSVVAASLASVLMAITMRAHLETGNTQTGLLQLISNPRTVGVISGVLGDPFREWTLQELANEAGMSRATLARNFRKALGTAPLAFVAEIRLSHARRAVRNSGKPLASIAYEAGYHSDASFSRAYRRLFGIAPGADRREMTQSGSRLDAPVQ